MWECYYSVVMAEKNSDAELFKKHRIQNILYQELTIFIDQRKSKGKLVC